MHFFTKLGYEDHMVHKQTDGAEQNAKIMWSDIQGDACQKINK